ADCPPPPIPDVCCPNKPPCKEQPCLPDCCPGADRGKESGCGCGCRHRRKKREANLREVAKIDFGGFMDKVAGAAQFGQDKNCNSERLRAVLEQSISDNTTLAVEKILDRIQDGQFIVRCTMNGVPEMERRVSFCQITKGNTTCAVSTGRMLVSPTNEITLNVSDMFRPDSRTSPEDNDDKKAESVDTPVFPTIIPNPLASTGPVPPSITPLQRGEGFV
ncbi:hypothetical protein PFISCL1PPCAC_13151, partial [Pristionchus fissidentatus]